jgi:glutamate dehydrogenase/leucine dehydrogenase
MVLDRMAAEGCEQVVFCHDRATGLRAIIAIHSTVLGAGLGGTRFWPYASEDEALADVCRLARGMTYKHAAAGLDQGGGKAVIIGDPARDRSEALIRAYGRFIEGLSGRYVTAEDVGTTQADMDLIRRETRHVTGVSESLGGSGDPSPATAVGVLWAMRAVAEHLWDDPSLEGRHVEHRRGGQGRRRARRPADAEGARLTVADPGPGRAAEVASAHGAEVVDPDAVHRRRVRHLLAVRPRRGAAGRDHRASWPAPRWWARPTTSWPTPEDAERLHHAGVLYAPDYVANAGGVINIAEERQGYDRARAHERIRGIHDTVRRVLQLAEEEGITTADAADRLAERRIEEVGRLALLRTRR